MIVSVSPDIMKLTRKKSVLNVEISVKLVPLQLIIVILVPKEELTQSQNAHAHPDNMKTEKRFVKTVLTNVQHVLIPLNIVHHALILTDQKPQIVSVLKDGMMI